MTSRNTSKDCANYSNLLVIVRQIWRSAERAYYITSPGIAVLLKFHHLQQLTVKVLFSSLIVSVIKWYWVHQTEKSWLSSNRSKPKYLLHVLITESQAQLATRPYHKLWTSLMASIRKRQCTAQCGKICYYQLFFAQVLSVVSPPYSQYNESLDGSYQSGPSAEEIHCHHHYTWPAANRAICCCHRTTNCVTICWSRMKLLTPR